MLSVPNIEISPLWWRVTVLVTQEAEAGELLEPRRWWLQWAKIEPLHSSLGNKSKTPSKNKQINNIFLYSRLGSINCSKWRSLLILLTLLHLFPAFHFYNNLVITVKIPPILVRVHVILQVEFYQDPIKRWNLLVHPWNCAWPCDLLWPMGD